MKDVMSSVPRHGMRSLAVGNLSVIIVLLAGAAMTAGCEDKNISPTDPVVLPGMTTTSQMASQLGLLVISTNSNSVMMKNGNNTVVVYADPAGQAYVNGVPVGQRGGFPIVEHQLYMPVGLVDEIRASLRPYDAAAGSSCSGWPVSPEPVKNTGLSPVNGLLGKVVIDPGHGGRDPGAKVGGRTEKTINLAIARGVATALLARGVQVVMTRNSDEFIELDDRVDIANSSDAMLFVSIHADSSVDRTDRGHTIIVSEVPSAASLAAANDISRSMSNAGSIVHSVRKDVRGLRVLRKTQIPAVLIETGFLSNNQDAVRLADGAFQQTLANAIADGIMAYLKG